MPITIDAKPSLLQYQAYLKICRLSRRSFWTTGIVCVGCYCKSSAFTVCYKGDRISSGQPAEPTTPPQQQEHFSWTGFGFLFGSSALDTIGLLAASYIRMYSLCKYTKVIADGLWNVWIWVPDRASKTFDLLKFQLAYLSHVRVRPPAEPLLNFYVVAHRGLPVQWMGYFVVSGMSVYHSFIFLLSNNTWRGRNVVLFWGDTVSFKPRFRISLATYRIFLAVLHRGT